MNHGNNHDNKIGSDSESDDNSWQSQPHINEQPHEITGVEEDQGPPDEQGPTDKNIGVEDDHRQNQQSHENTGVQTPDCMETPEDEPRHCLTFLSKLLTQADWWRRNILTCIICERTGRAPETPVFST